MEKVLLVTGASSELGINLINKVYSDYKRIYLQYRNMNDQLQETIDYLKGKTEIVLFT